MSAFSLSGTNLLCAIGRHHDTPVNDDNVENLRSYHLECTRCRRVKEVDLYEPSDGSWMAKGNLAGF